MYRLLTIILFISSFTAAAQTDTVYYNSEHLPCGKDSASRFDVSHKINDTDYYVAAYYYKTLWLQSTYHYKSLEPPVYHGITMRYFKNGDTIQGVFNENRYTGETRDYYDEGEDTLRVVYNQKDGKLHGTLISYYPNGKVKRRARYANDKLVQGNQYDEQGKETKYTPYSIMPEPLFNINKYLARNVKYPAKARDSNIEGRVIVLFIVDKKGKIKNAKVLTDTHPLLNAEALRVINNMKAWKPGMQDDKPVNVYFTVPILFKLT